MKDSVSERDHAAHPVTLPPPKPLLTLHQETGVQTLRGSCLLCHRIVAARRLPGAGRSANLLRQRFPEQLHQFLDSRIACFVGIDWEHAAVGDASIRHNGSDGIMIMRRVDSGEKQTSMHDWNLNGCCVVALPLCIIVLLQ